MKILNREKLTDLPHLNLIRIQYQDRHDRERSWIYASRGSKACPDAVVVVAWHGASQKLVLIREYRVPLQGIQYGFPAGLVDAGESVAQAGIRELREETGLRVTEVIRESPPIFSSSGLTDESTSLLYVTCEGTPSAQFTEGSEEIEVVLLSRQEAAELVARPDLRFDVKSWIILDRFAATGAVI